MIRSWFRIIGFCCGLLASGGLAAHPYHQSLMELEWNAERSYWELALRFLPEDLEEALQYYAGSRIDLERSANVDQLIQNYIQQHVQFLPADADSAQPTAPPQWQWVGKEVEYKAVWLYFQVTAPAPPLRLRNSLLFAQHEQQVNRVFLLYQGQRIPFDFSAGAGDQNQLLRLPDTPNVAQ